MRIRLGLLTLLAVFAFFSQVSTSYVRQEAVEMRALVRQVQADRIVLQTMQTQEQVRRRLAEVERWAGALDGLAPPTPAQIQPSLQHALSPSPMPRPAVPARTESAAFEATSADAVARGEALSL